MSRANTFITWLEHWLTPVAARIERQRHISSIKNGMIALMAVLMVGSISLMLMGIGGMFPQDSAVRLWFNHYNDLISLPFQFTFGLLSIYCAASVAWHHAQQMQVPILPAITGSIMATLMLNVSIVDDKMVTDYLDSRGLFVALIASLGTVELMALFIRKRITIRINGLPAGIAQTFESIIPLLVSLIAATVVHGVVANLSGGLILPQVLMSLLAPAFNSIDTPQAVFLISFLEMIFWFIGLNGYAIIVGVVLPFMTQYLAENAAAFAAGAPIPHVFAPNFWDYFLGFSGSGITGALVILSLRSRSQELRAVGKAAVVPAIFTISEPVVFGLPVAWNPWFFIPFVLGTPTIGVMSWYIFHWGWVRPPVTNVGATPIPLAQYLSTMDWRAVILGFTILGIATLVYYPVFRLYERSLLQKTQQQDSRQAAFDSLDLDF